MPPPPPPPHTQSPNAPHPNAFFNTVLNNPQAASSNTPPRPARPSEPSGFSATQRGLQARGKTHSGLAAVKSAESYEQRQRREEAASILESVEMLIWYAASRNEVPYPRFLFPQSQPPFHAQLCAPLHCKNGPKLMTSSRIQSLAQTRKHYQDIVYGLSKTDDVAWEDEWDVPVQERVRSGSESPKPGSKGKETAAKGKKRASLEPGPG